MWGTWVLAAISIAPPTFVERPRDTIAVVVNRPTATPTKMRTVDVVAALDDLFKTKTTLAVASVEPERIADCEGAVLCMVGRLTSSPPPAYLLLMTMFTATERADRVSVMLVDVLSGEARVESPFVALEDDYEWKRWLEQLVTNELRPAFETTGHDGAAGSIQLTVDVTGVTMLLDGQTIGVLPGRTATVLDVRPGQRELRLRHERHGEVQETITVARGTPTAIELEMVEYGTARALTTFGGWGVAGLGLAIAMVTALNPQPGITCDAPPCEGAGPRTLESLFRGTASVGEHESNRGVILAVPLGAALIATGATASVTTKLIGGPRDPPWLQILLGVGAGVLTYTVAALIHTAAAR